MQRIIFPKETVCPSVASPEKGNRSLTVTGQTTEFFSVKLKTTKISNSNEQTVLLVALHIHRSTGERVSATSCIEVATYFTLRPCSNACLNKEIIGKRNEDNRSRDSIRQVITRDSTNMNRNYLPRTKIKKSGKDDPILVVYVSGLIHHLLRLHGKCFRRAFQAFS